MALYSYGPYSEARLAEYAAQTVRALAHVMDSFPRMSLHDRMAERRFFSAVSEHADGERRRPVSI